MPTKKLTDLFVERVKPPAAGRIEYFDAVFGGLALRVTDRGNKSWSLHYRIWGRLRRLTIGQYPAIKPAQARREASAALDQVRQGIDPSVEKKAQRIAPTPEPDTFRVLVQDYLDRYAHKNTAPATFKETKRTLERDVVPLWRDRAISTITRGDVIGLVDAIAARGAEVYANRTLARLRALFNWAVEKDRLSTSPCIGAKPPNKEQVRDRSLTDDEVRWFWTACDESGWPFGPLAKLLLLTAQRRDEVAGMEWPELNLVTNTWTIPRARAKNNRSHEVQLSTAAVEVLRSLPRVGDCLVFTTTGNTCISGFSRAKRRLDAAMIRARRRSLSLPEGDAELRKFLPVPDGMPLPIEIPNWTLHDLRRTAATGMARLSIAPHVVDKVLNHVSSTIRGVAAVYNRFEYLDERRVALEAWGQYVTGLLAPTVANIVSMRR